MGPHFCSLVTSAAAPLTASWHATAPLGLKAHHVTAQAAIALARLNRAEAAPALLAAAARAKEVGLAPELKPRATTEVVRKSTPGRMGKLEADISGGKIIYLVVTAGPDTFDLDHADWMEPHFTGPGGDQKLTDLKWKSATQGFGATHVNGNCFGAPQKVVIG